MKKLFPFLIILFIMACSDAPTSPYVILKATKTDEGHVFDVQVYGRLNKQQLVAIASKIKKDSAQYDNLQIDYVLPGNNIKNLGGVTVYATINYHDVRKVTALDTVNDLHDNKLSFLFTGFTPEQAKHMLSFNPPDTLGKTILGKFIDDNIKTVSIVYKDNTKEGDVYILEMDTAGKVVSATQPMIVTHNGVKKMVISPKGDYLTLTDDILTMYSSDDPEKPYRSIKAGM
ncbi:MAG: hypothetical protein ACXVJE_06175 [Mucilaginibacter sp.]